ncbi:MAG TPA: Wzz/FepE/Etk N-terminal domain-containing protein, partial [Bryobacteraceae bacterium]
MPPAIAQNPHPANLVPLPDLEPPGPGLLDLLLVIAARKWFILGMTIVGAVVAAAVALLLPPSYTATAVIMPPQQQQSAASSLLGQLGPIASLSGKDLGFKTPADLYIGILTSRTIADDLIARFDLQKSYRDKTLTDARRTLTKRSRFSSGKDSLIKIAVDDENPRRAAALANGYVDSLYRQNSRLALTEASQRRLFFEQQMMAEKEALQNTEGSMASTQERTGMLQVGSQIDSVIRSMAQLRAEILGREVALASLKRGATAENPMVVRQEAELAALRDELHKLESNRGANRPGDPLIPTAQVPKAGLEYVRAIRDVKYHETLFELLSKQFEV